jgi:hypothetical protein
MNRIAKNLIVAAGLAVGTLTLTVTPAHADPLGPGGLNQGPIVDPIPHPQPDPQAPVDDVDEIAAPPKCTHGCGGNDDAPKPFGDAPDAGVINNGPLEAGEPDFPLDQGCFTGCDLPEEPTAEPTPVVEPELIAEPAVFDPTKRATADTLEFGEAQEAVVADEGHVNLLWIVAAGAALSALLLAAIARRRRQQAHEA